MKKRHTLLDHTDIITGVLIQEWVSYGDKELVVLTRADTFRSLHDAAPFGKRPRNPVAWEWYKTPTFHEISVNVPDYGWLPIHICVSRSLSGWESIPTCRRTPLSLTPPKPPIALFTVSV